MAVPTLLRTLAVALTMGSALATQIPRPPCLVPYEPFEYTGCFKDLGSPPALEWRSLLDQNAMTIEICTAYCKGNSNRYAGLSYYGVCYCGMSIEGPKADGSECNLPCSGNKDQICGGDNVLSVWEDPTFPPIGEATVDGFEAIGCWTDESGAGRALAYRQDMDASTMTNEKCQQKCLEGGYPLAGTEFAGECYCGAVMSMDTKTAGSNDCNLPCNGDSDETCGGHSRMSIYRNDQLLSSEPCGGSPPVHSVEPTEPGGSGWTMAPPASSTAAPTTTAAPSTNEAPTTTEATTSSAAPPSSVPSTSKEAPTTSAAPTTKEAPTTSAAPTTKEAPTTKAAPSSTSPTTSSCVPATTAPDGHPPQPTCEYSVGHWCSHPLPPFHDRPSCLSAVAHCSIQTFTCHVKAGLLQHVGCLAYSQWCLTLKAHCLTSHPPLSKQFFFHSHPPRGHTPSDYHPSAPVPCPSPHHHPKDQCPLPTADTLCASPHGKDYPLGHISAPIVTCNDLAHQHSAGQPFKLYTSGADSGSCKAYARTSHMGGPRWGRPVDGAALACADACREQRAECVRHYAEPRKGYAGRRVLGHDGRTYGQAVAGCREQEKECLEVNRGVSGEGKCEKYCEGPY